MKSTNLKISLLATLLFLFQACSGGSSGGGSGTGDKKSTSTGDIVIYNASDSSDKITVTSFSASDDIGTESSSEDFLINSYSALLDDDAFWVGTSDGTILRVGLDGATEETITGVDAPVYLASNDTDLWVADDGNGSKSLGPKIYRISKSTNSVKESFDVADVSETYDGLFLTDEAVYILISNGFQLGRIDLTSKAITYLDIAGDTTDIASLTNGIYGYGSMAKVSNSKAFIFDDYFDKILVINLDTFTVTDIASMDTLMAGASNAVLQGSSAGLYFYVYDANKIYKLDQTTFDVTKIYSPTEDIDLWLVNGDTMAVELEFGKVVILDKNFDELATLLGCYPDEIGYEVN